MADKLKAVLLNLHDRFGASQEKIKTIQGLPTQPLERELGEVWSRLRQVRMVSHTFDMTRIEKKAEEVKGLMTEMESEITRLEKMEQDREWLGMGLVALFIALAITTLMLNRTENKSE